MLDSYNVSKGILKIEPFWTVDLDSGEEIRLFKDIINHMTAHVYVVTNSDYKVTIKDMKEFISGFMSLEHGIYYHELKSDYENELMYDITHDRYGRRVILIIDKIDDKLFSVVEKLVNNGFM